VKVTVLKECGYDEASLGFSLSYNATVDRAKQLLPKFSFGLPGENKFLESIYIWVDVTAPRFWWQEADTYRVGNSKQSESTMHTLLKRQLRPEDFEYGLDYLIRFVLNRDIERVKNKEIPFDDLKNSLPEGFLQRRIWCLNYKCLQNIYNQRYNHKLPQWRYFCEEMLKQIEHSEFIKKEE